MIVLIVGDFGVGKDTTADLILKTYAERDECFKVEKILSYTTREPRENEKLTHEFCSQEEFLSFNDIIAQTKIGDHYYGTRRGQFNPKKMNLYCVDDQGVRDVINADIDRVVVVEVVRPVWLIDLPEDRLNRQRHYEPYEYSCDYRIMNDGDMEKLKVSVSECCNFLTSEMKKRL